MRAAQITILLIILLLATGCVYVSDIQNRLPGLPQKAAPGLITTTQSITADVKSPTTDSPISARYDFTPAIEVMDVGNADAEGAVCISGLDEMTFKGFMGCECQDFTLYASEEDGDLVQQLEFGPYSIETDAEKDALMTVTTRYKYETTGTAKACIKKDVYSTAGCQTTNLAKQKVNLLTSSTSGAVKITKVTESILPVDDELVTLVFEIEVEKASKGELYDPDKAGYPTCRTEEDQGKKITGEISGLPEGNAVCDEAELDEDGEGLMTCEAQNIRLFDSSGRFLFSEDSYEPEIEIKLKYGYEQIQSIKFQVEPKKN